MNDETFDRVANIGNGAVIQRVEDWYGTRIPSVLKRLALWYGGSQTQSDEFAQRFGGHLSVPASVFSYDEEAPFELRLPNYYTDPIELLPVFGSYNRYGYLDLAPELQSPDDLPIAVSDPNSYDLSVYSVGTSLAELLAYLSTTNPELTDPNLREVFGFPIEPSLSPVVYRNVVPTKYPNDYRYEWSLTGGVLAPRDAFDGGPPLAFPGAVIDVRSSIERAERALETGYPATTMLIARECRASFPTLSNIEVDDMPHLLTLWARAAVTLDRPFHAKMLLALRDSPNRLR